MYIKEDRGVFMIFGKLFKILRAIAITPYPIKALLRSDDEWVFDTLVLFETR